MSLTQARMTEPSVGYMRKERLPGGRPIKGFPNFAPDLAIKIISSSEERADMARKVREYFATGARQVYPNTQQVIVYTGPSETRVIKEERK